MLSFSSPLSLDRDLGLREGGGRGSLSIWDGTSASLFLFFTTLSTHGRWRPLFPAPASAHMVFPSFFPLNSFFQPAGQQPRLSLSPAAPPGRGRLIVILISRHRRYRRGACDLRSLGSCRINGVTGATGNRKQVFLNTHYNKALIVIQRTTRVCANNSSAGQREGEAPQEAERAQMVGRCERARWRSKHFPVSHLRMCPGTERLLRPRWFTAWTIILPVQLTLPWREGGGGAEGRIRR